MGLAVLLAYAGCDSDDGEKGHPSPACEPVVEVPNLPLTWQMGAPYLVRWSGEGPCGSWLRIELLQGGETCATIADSAADTGGYLWTCAACPGDSGGYTIRITDLATGRADVGDANFTISPVRGDRVAWADETSPASVTAGSLLELHWTTSGFSGDEVLIELLGDGAVCDTIAAAAPNTGTYAWTVSVPSPAATDYTLRICDLTTGASAVTDWSFHILPGGSLAVSSPAGGETWLMGTVHNVTWSPAGASTDSVRIELLHDGTVCRLIAQVAPGGGVYSWTVAGCPNGYCDYTVRVTRLASGASGESQEPFCILMAGLALIAPSGGEVWYRDESRTITWQSTGAIGETLALLLLRDGTVCDTIAAEAPTAAGSYTWGVAGCACETPPCDSCAYTVRAVDSSFGLIAASHGVFCIAEPGLTVTAPEGGEVWNEGESHTIAWETRGPAGDGVRIELLLDGAVCATIADSVDNSGAYPWTATPCGADTAGYAIRVTDLDTGASDAGDAAFRIAPPTLTLVSPNGGQEWIAGGNYTIAWGHSGRAGEAVKIELLQAGQVCATLAESTPNDRSLVWMAGQCAGDSCAYRVRITDLETGLADSSDATFCIRSYVFTVLAPADGDRWHRGTTQEISWTRAGTSGRSVRIDLLHDGALCETIDGDVLNTGLYSWTAAPCVADTCDYAILVVDLTTGATALSAGSFCIPPSTLTVTAPSDGDAWIAGTTHAITWEQEGQAGGTVRIELLRDGAPCDTIAVGAPNEGTYAWTAAPCDGDSCGYQVRVTDPTAGTADESAGSFCVTSPRLRVTEPDGGEAWLEGSACSIAWQITGTAGLEVRIELLREGAVCHTIAASAENSGVHAWIAEACTLATSGYRVRVTDTTTGASDQSDADFTISPVLTVTSPGGGETWVEGTTHTITWTTSHTHGDSVRIELLRDGSPCDTLSTSTPNGGTFSWQAARCSEQTGGYAVRITDLATSTQDVSDGAFTISPPTLTVLDPNGGEQWLEGGSQTITWVSVGTAGDSVRVELLRAGQPVDTLSAGTPNNGSLAWTPVQHGRQNSGYQVRITDLSLGVQDASDAAFSILRDFRVTAPNGGEAWDLGSTQTITWMRTASAGDSVLIALLCAGEPCDTISTGTPNDGSQTWTVTAPGADSCNYRIRITDLTTGDTDAGDASFCVATPVLTVTSPNGAEVWDAGSTVPITWTATAGIGDSVMIELLAGGAVCDTLIEATPDDGSFEWNIATCPGADSCGYAVRIRDRVLDVADTSDESFCILDESVTLTSPNGGEEWYTGATYTIAWTHAETAGENVRLLLLRDGAVRDTIAASTANDDSIQWVAARFGDISVGYRISITDLATGDVDSTDGALRINPGPTLIAPNGGEAWVQGDLREVLWADPASAASTMRIDLLHSGELCATLAGGTDNDSSFHWTVAQCGSDTSDYRVRIVNTETEGSDWSDATFSIYTDPTVTYPNGGETLADGEAHTITWRHATGSGGENVCIWLTRAGATCDVVVATTANNGEYEWTFAQCGGESSNYKILIQNLTTEDADSSDAVFSIE